MNVRTFLLGALCGAVVFAIVDRLVQERERERALGERPAPAARASQDGPQEELQNLTESTPSPAPSQDLAPSSDAQEMQETESVDTVDEGPAAAHLDQRPRVLQSPDGAEGQDGASAAKPDTQTSRDEKLEPQTAAPPDDTSWGPYMEQNLRQFLASHRSARQFDVLSVQCRAGRCDVRAAGFDESTGPVWQQVLYDLSLQPWYEFGEVGSDYGRFAEYEGRFVLRTYLKRLPRK